MFEKVRNILLFIPLLSVLNPQLNAGAVEGATLEKKPEQTAEKKETEEKQEEISKFEKISKRATLSSGIGFIRAFQKNDLRANGFADIKLSYFPDYKVADRDVFLTLRYVPIDVEATSNIDNMEQEYAGIMELFNLGAEVLLPSKNWFEWLASAEVGLVKSSFKALIPISEYSPPIKKWGAEVLVGTEARFKPIEKISIGPRVYIGFGTFTTFNFLANATFYF